MRWLLTIVVCGVLAAAVAEPEPKKYKPDDRKTNSTNLTDAERKFLREVEKKFGIKSDIPAELKKDENKTDVSPTKIKLPFPAVVAIEIVNDTESETKTKGKRTIDANLGYGYQTNHGYTYTYFGKPEEKGKFMVYPYSQEDIPPPSHGSGYGSKTSSNKYQESASLVDIQPSRAYELVQVKQEGNGYEYKKPSVEFKNKYESVQGVESPPPPYPTHSGTSGQTLYTTYNGESFSGLQGQFPSVSSNYLVDASQLAQYQGNSESYDQLNADHHKVVPVLVLRIPSSSLKDPSAELYADTHNQQLSQYFNSANLQELVNQYFRKLGYNAGPQVQTVNSPLPVTHESSQHSGNSNHQYADPYVTPSYSHSDYSGVQYSAVQPTMAKYPAQSYPQYQQVYEQQEQIQYHYDPQTGQMYYIDYQYPSAGQDSQYAQQSSSPTQHHAVSTTHIEYGTPNEASAASAAYAAPAATYGAPTQSAEYSAPAPAAEYSAPVASETVHSQADYSYAKNYRPSKQSGRPRYSSKITYSNPSAQKESVAIYPTYTSHSIEEYRAHPQSDSLASYLYQKEEIVGHDSKGLVLTENFPSKDHTHATALKYDQKPKKTKPVQSMTYVTPVPQSMSKYQSHYNVLSPQMVLNNAEKVSYVTSQSLPGSYYYTSSNSNPEAEYTAPINYSPPVSSQKAPSYPRNYHSSAKRNANRSTLKSSRKEKREESQTETA